MAGRILKLSEEDIRKLATEIAKQMFIQIGVQIDNPIEVQKDMIYLREWRTSVSKAKNHGMLTVITILTTGIIGLVYTFFKHPTGN